MLFDSAKPIQAALAYSFLIGFFCYIFYATYKENIDASRHASILNALLVILSMIFGYYFGSSSESVAKSEILNQSRIIELQDGVKNGKK